jgi:hypothetical protein
VLGNKKSALSEAERATKLRPSNKDAVMGLAYEENLALVEAAVGERNRAIAILERLLKLPYNRTVYGMETLRLLPRSYGSIPYGTPCAATFFSSNFSRRLDRRFDC